MYGGHDNSTKHPPLDECLASIDFMYEYVDLYMATKPKGIRYVVLNVYGGESLHHPDVVHILQRCREVYENHYADRWPLILTTTSNLIVPRRKMAAIIPLIDQFICSYHTENSPKQKELWRTNVLAIKQAGRAVKAVVLMHAESDKFADAQSVIEWCKHNDIAVHAKQLDHTPNWQSFKFDQKQIQWWDNLHKEKTFGVRPDLKIHEQQGKFDLSATGRACCGGRQFCRDGNRRQRDHFVSNQFRDWYCSVNEFFLYIKQVNGEIFVNKDCFMSFNGAIGPIGNLRKAHELIAWTRENLANNTMPVIQCKKSNCLCGMCAPKAQNLDDFNSMMGLYRL